MPPLYLIIDTNLISARNYGIELDLEGSRALLEHCVEETPRESGAGRERQQNKLRQLEEIFLGVLLHAWPEPADPVVRTLREQAKASLERLRMLHASCPGV